MSLKLIIESGSTKTDWCFIGTNNQISQFKTSGINPRLQSSEEIISCIEIEIGKEIKQFQSIDIIYYYGAGIANESLSEIIKAILLHFFSKSEIFVSSDLLAAARSLCQKSAGIACILGTGSNSCFYDGNQILYKHVSLGYIAGDEGSGNYMGKKVLQYYAYKTFDNELMIAFETLFGNNIQEIITTIYKQTFPNRYLAQFSKLLFENRGHYMVENIIEDCLMDFFSMHIFKYRQSWKAPIHFTGSIAFAFKDVINSLCEQYELELGNISQSPMDGLISFHQK